MASNIVVAPHDLELGAEPAEFIDKRLHLRRRPARAASTRNDGPSDRSQAGPSESLEAIAIFATRFQAARTRRPINWMEMDG
jgi:hypothetical protein